MTFNKGFRIVGCLFGTLFLFVLFSYIFFPIKRLNAFIDNQLAVQGLQLLPGADKTIFPGVAWKQPTLSASQNSILHFDLLSLHPDWKSLLSGAVAFSSTASVNNGKIELLYTLTGSRLLDLKARDLRLEEIPFFKSSLGGGVGGLFWSEGSFIRSKNGPAGELRLEIKNLDLKGVKLGAFSLPDVSALAAQGMVKMVAGKARLESFTVQGEGIYMRLSGDIPSGATAVTSPLNLSLEIMPKPEFLEKQKLVFMLLSKFAVSPGVYQIPVRGTIMKPEIL